ncbi:tripartite motif-containing protein 2-like [Anneissia japonica]|uniref:tripartite motif-containing protein 2-like n=1 Tax=Anneissia japonica TaxID=1529436 RepID=UPI001425ABAB|nr:tripartite motif-containing protein 2-like [Anneissia japonica]
MAEMGKPSTDEVIMCCKCSQVLRSNDVAEPRYLDCLHAFCCRCMWDILELHQPNTCPVCPLCQASSPQTKINDIPTVFFLRNKEKCESMSNKIKEEQIKGNFNCQRCTEGNAATHWCLLFNEPLLVCKECASLALHPDLVEHPHSLSETPAWKHLSENIYCPIHNKVSDIFCQDCQTSICESCNHRNHQVQNLHEEACMFREKIVSKIKDSEEIVNTLTRRLVFIEQEEASLKASSELAAQQMAAFFDELRRCIGLQEKHLQEQLVNTVGRKTESMKGDSSKTQRQLNDFKHLSSFLSAANRYGTDCDIMTAGEVINRNLSNIIPMAVHEEPEINGFIAFKPGMLIPLRLSKPFGKRFQDVISHIPTMTKQVGSVRETPVSSRHSTFEIIQTDSGIEIKISAFKGDGQCYCRGGDPFVVEIRKPGGEVARPRLFDNDSGEYTSKYVPNLSGKHYVDVHLFGRPIKGSPYIFDISEDALPAHGASSLDIESYDNSCSHESRHDSLLSDTYDTPHLVSSTIRPESGGYVKMDKARLSIQTAQGRNEDINAYLEIRRRSSRRGSYVLQKIDEFGLQFDEDSADAVTRLKALHEIYEPVIEEKPQPKRWFRILKHW